MQLNGLFNKVKKNTKNKSDKEKDVSDMGKYVWATPTIILTYLQNVIQKKAAKPIFAEDPTKPIDFIPADEELTCKIRPWKKFKELLFDIYDHRIEHAWEINGAINNTYLTLDEHLLIFFVDKYKMESRSSVEMHILEFLANLKYYSDFWKRARTFSLIYGFLKADDFFLGVRRSGTSENRFPQKLNDGKYNETDNPYNDIYIQEFFLQCYCIASKERSSYLDSPEGFTYMPFRFQDGISKKILTPFVSDRQFQKWAQKVKTAIKRTKLSELDDNESEYIDIDVLLAMFIEEFKTSKESFGREVTKQFMRMLETKEGRMDLTLDNYINIFNQCKKSK